MSNTGNIIHNGYTTALDRLYPGSSISTVERLTGGVSADVYRLDLSLPDGRVQPLVLRAHGATHSGHDAELEFQLLEALYNGGLSVPEPLLVDMSAELVPDPFLIMKFVEGNTHIPEARLDQHVELMAQALTRIHTLPLTGLPDLPKREEPWPELLQYLPEGDEWEALAKRLHDAELPAFEGAPQLLHGDFWPENLLWQDEQIVAVLDWEDAALGDRYADVAAARVELRYLFGQEVMERFSTAYARYLPIDRRRILLWQIYVAAAAQKYMGSWGLPEEREARMRREALASIREAAEELACG